MLDKFLLTLAKNFLPSASLHSEVEERQIYFWQIKELTRRKERDL